MTAETPTLADMARAVYMAREAHANVKYVLDEARAEWEREHAPMIEAVLSHKMAMDMAEAALREAAIIEYGETGNRKPTPGVEIKVFSTLQYDREAAMAWATKHNLALTLDVKAFEAIARAQPLPIVRKVDEPKATLATDMGKALANGTQGGTKHGE